MSKQKVPLHIHPFSNEMLSSRMEKVFALRANQKRIIDHGNEHVLDGSLRLLHCERLPLIYFQNYSHTIKIRPFNIELLTLLFPEVFTKAVDHLSVIYSVGVNNLPSMLMFIPRTTYAPEFFYVNSDMDIKNYYGGYVEFTAAYNKALESDFLIRHEFTKNFKFTRSN
ncbi:hypothetical protein [Enterobacter pseudoroggenkampii]|uniref:hypothetical protein n=1 Tax=Enterobacter pseudoroggenkampii TaxID=2996112 RepID=UPI0022651420|nr:hypothetical protein [Enterobacter pseudoroggenkampii]MCX8289083.1 hypothetical protein [Enterobacter pseudoroggenkampii]